MLSILSLSGLYWVIVNLRHFLYKKGICKRLSFSDKKIISVGNIELGGTGKTTCVEYIVDMLATQYPITIISRGYKRNSKGTIKVTNASDSYTVGDESMQLFNKYINNNNVNVYVSQKRESVISKIEKHIFILDDGLQYKRLICSCNIVLVRFDRPFFKDHIFPFGRLRDTPKILTQANVIIITKCDRSISKDIRKDYIAKIKPFIQCTTPILFSYIDYGCPYSLFSKDIYKDEYNILLITSIAAKKCIHDYVKKRYRLVNHIAMSDHHKYSKSDIGKIISKYVVSGADAIMTTAKDAPKLANYKDLLKNIQIFVLPISMKFVDQCDTKIFNGIIYKYTL